LPFQPNRLVLESGHRLIVDCFSQIPGTRLALRPARKRLFTNDPEIPTLAVELNKPAFAALVREDDDEATPILIFETDPISAGIRDLYRRAELPFVEADQAGGRGVLRFEKPGFSAKMTFDDRGAETAVDSIFKWLNGHDPAERGPLVKSPVELTVSKAFSSFAGDLGLAIHHQMPFGYVAGYRPDLPRATARHTIEVSLGLSPQADPEAPVILPIRIELEPDENREPAHVERDLQVAEFVCNVGMPMAAIQPADGDKYRITYSLDGIEDVEIELQEEDRWKEILHSIARNALQATGRA